MPSIGLILELGLIAIVFAGLPLGYLWKKPGYSFFQKLNWVLVFMTFDLIVFGAFTRLTDSGLGCPDWPGCYGASNPLHAINVIVQAENTLPSGPVTVMKAWIEMIHRYLAMTVGALIVVQLSLAASKVKSLGREPLFGSIALFLLVFLQGAFGAWTVTLKLQPIIVMIHLMLALGLLACLTAYAQQSWQEKTSTVRTIRIKPLPAPLLLIAALVLFTQVFLGAWVSTNYAVLACPDFPTCLGEVWPQTNWSEGYTLWRQLGLNAQGEYISPVALQTIHWAHRLFAIVLIVVLGALAWRALQVSTPAIASLGKFAKLLLGLLALQVVTGISNVVFQWPLAVALLHTAGSAALVFCLVRMSYWASWKSPMRLKTVKPL
ncbi:COX15/CtaA family protein [Polynucleobacter necessarius]|uniref:COX15/CtaA family protein n=1 Tax=Polynucleobacter necessarius TaxID=576610 RepID=UPI000E0904E2|nr:COX15/CtaA family protein [Polynucleobacter necessarius]